jgi:catechol 2,3-dioxygenase-like lactoylglutathione lyase family enzyme
MSANWWHVGLTVSDMDRSLAFYRDVVGMEVTADDRHLDNRAFFDPLTNNPGTQLRVAWLTDGTFVLQLVQYLAKGGDTLEPQHNKVGSPHLSFYVPDVRAKRDEIEARGDVVITSEVIGERSFYVVDPDGVPVEFFLAPA